MPFDGIVTANIVYDLNRMLATGKIDKIYQLDKEDLVLHIRANKNNYKLLLSCNSSCARAHITDEDFSYPQNPTGFCMLLRKHLQGSRITSVEQKDSERIVELNLDTFNELGIRVNKKLLIEIMGKHSNIILIDSESNKIIDTIKRVSIDVNRFRQILPGSIYIYPPNHDKVSFYNVDEEKFKQLLINCQDRDMASKILVDNIQGISPVIASQLTGEEWDNINHLYSSFRRLIQQIEENSYNPVVYINRENNSCMDFYSYTLIDKSITYKEVSFETINKATDYYYANKDISNRKKQIGNDLNKSVSTILNKLYLKKQRLLEDIEEAKDSEKYRIYGEIITANIHNIKQGSNSVNLLNYYDETYLDIPLDIRIAPSKNAQKYFKKYNKSKVAIIEKNNQLIEVEKDIEYLESIGTFIDNANNADELDEIRNELIEGHFLRKRKNNYKPVKKKMSNHISFTSTDGFKIFVGKNNNDNDILTLKTASNKDLWLHTKDIHGSHVILFTEGKEVTETALREAASLAAFYSKARQSDNVPVDYTFVKYVKKPSGAKPGMVIYTDNKTLYAKPKEIDNNI